MLDATGVLVADLNPGSECSSPTGFTEFNGQLFFSAEGEDASGEAVGRELYRLDENDQASLVADIKVGEGSSDPAGFTVFNNALYFAATGSAGRELYRLDTNGTVTRVADINPGAAGADPAGFTPFDGSLYFAATASQGRELFRLEANQQVSQVQDIKPGSASSNPEGFTEFNGKLYFAATGTGGREAYVLNRGGNANQINDINPGTASSNPSDFTVFNNTLYFSATNAHGRTLFRQAASGVNPVQVLDFNVVSNPTNLTPFGDQLYFRGANLQGGSELYALDTSENLTQIESSAGQALLSPSVFTAYNDTLYFAATTNQGFTSISVAQSVAQTRTLYRLELNGAQTVAVPIELPAGVVLESGQPDEFLEFPEFQGDLYFSAAGITGLELYRVNRLDQVDLVTDLDPGPTGSNPLHFVTYRDAFYFSARAPSVGRELFRLAQDATTIAIVDGELRLTDAAGDRDNRLVISSDGVRLTIRDENGHDIFGVIAGMTGVGTNEVVIPLASLAGIRSLVVDTRGGDDSFTWNAAQSAQSLLLQFTTIRFAGGANSSTGGDFLRVVGDHSLTAIYTPDGSLPGQGTVQIPFGFLTTTIRFTDSEGIDVTGMDRALFLAPQFGSGADQVLVSAGKDARDGTLDAMLVSGSSLDVNFETAHFFANRQVEINTGRNSDGGDAITLSNVGGLHANHSLYISTAATTGGASDLVHVDGAITLAGEFRVTSDRIEIDGAVQASGDVRLTALESVIFFASAALTVTGSANVFVQADSDHVGTDPLLMHLGATIVAANGSMTMLAGGDLTLSDVRTTAGATITSMHGAILDLSDNGAGDLRAATANLQAALGVGAADNPLETRLSQLTATSGGGLWLANVGALVVQAIQTAGPLALDNFGAMTVNGAVRSGGGAIALHATGNLTLNSIALIDAQSGATGVTLTSIATFTSVGAIAMADGSLVDARGGPLMISAHHHITLSDVRTTANATITTTHGAILDLADQGGVDLTAATANLQATLGIGAADNPLETRLAQLTATSGGGLWLTNGGSIVIDRVVAAGDVVLTVMGGATVVHGILTQGTGQLWIDALESLRIDGPLTTTFGDIQLFAGNDILVAATFVRSEAGDIALVADRDGNGNGTLRIVAEIFSGSGATIFSLAGADGQFSGSLHGGGSLIKQGAGTLEITPSSQNTYFGPTEVLAGTLIVNGTIGATSAGGPVTIAGGATLSGGGNIFAPIFSSATTSQIVTSGNLRLGDGSTAGMQFAGRFLIGANHVVVLRDADFAQVGVLTSLANGATLIALGGVQVPLGGRLEGNGTIDGPVTILFGGAVSPGTNTGVLGVRDLALQTGARFDVDINGVVAGASYDQLRVTGAVVLQGAEFVIASSPFNAANGTVLVLINNDGFDPINGRFVDANGFTLAEGAQLKFGQFEATLSYAGGLGGNDVTLTLGRQVFFALPGVATGNSPGGQADRNADTAAAAFAFFAVQSAEAGVTAEAETAPLAATQEAQNGGRSESMRVRGVAREELATRIEQRFRLYFRVFFDALAQEGDQEYDLSPEELRNLTAVFRRFRFPNGHFKVYIQEFGSKSERLILDVQVYDGRVVTEQLQEDENESQLQSQPPTPPAAPAPEAGPGGAVDGVPETTAAPLPDTDATPAETRSDSFTSAASPTAMLLVGALRLRCRASEREQTQGRRRDFSRYSHLVRRQHPR